MPTDDFLDFDAFEAEQSGEPLTFKLGGREWTAAYANDAVLYLSFARGQAEGGAAAVLGFDSYLENMLLESERAAFRQMLSDKHVSMRTAAEVVGRVFQRATGLPFGEARPSAEGRSPTGGRSKGRSRSKGSKPDGSLSVAS